MPVHINASRVELYGKGCLMALFHDIREHNRGKHSGNSSRAMHSLSLNPRSKASMPSTLRGFCTFMNRLAAKMLGYDVEEVLGKTCTVSFIPAGRTVRRIPPRNAIFIAHCVRARLPCRFGMLLAKDGSAFPVEYSASPIIENGAIKGVVVAFSDLTEKNPPQARSSMRNTRKTSDNARKKLRHLL